MNFEVYLEIWFKTKLQSNKYRNTEIPGFRHPDWRDFGIGNPSEQLFFRFLILNHNIEYTTFSGESFSKKIHRDMGTLLANTVVLVTTSKIRPKSLNLGANKNISELMFKMINSGFLPKTENLHFFS